MKRTFSARHFIFAAALAVLFVIVGCQASPTATPTAAPLQQPTDTPIPTATLEPTATLTPTELPPTEPPLPTATALPPIATTRIIVNVRAGPSAGFALIGKLQRGVSKDILGKSPDSQWFQIDYEGKLGWIAADFTDVRGGTSGVPVVAVARAPTATQLPTSAVVSRLQPTTTPTADVPPPSGRIYFVVKQPDESYTTSWVRPARKQEIFSDVTLGTLPGDLNTALSTNASPLDWSAAKGKLAYVVGSGTQNLLQTIDENQNVVDVASHGAIVTPRWIGNGDTIAYIGYDTNFQNQKIYIVNSDGANRRECFGARSGETLRGLDVSPVTNEIVFVSNLSGGSELWLLGPDCANPVRLTHFNVDTTAPAFSPDGTQLVFVSNQASATQFDIYLIKIADPAGARFMISGFSPVFSPDGNWIAFNQNGEVYIMDITGNRIQTVAPGYRPAWAQE